MVWKNLKNSFPEKTDRELRKIQKEFYRNLCDYAVETLKLLTIKPEELSRRMVMNGMDVMKKYFDREQSILFLASHQFNWEWVLTSACVSFPVPVDFIYQPVNTKVFDAFSLQSRTRFGAYAIKRDEVAREMVRRKEIVRAVASVADQYPGHSHDKKYFTTFLGQETVFFYGTNQLITLTQYPVIYFQVRKKRRGYYEGFPVEIAQPPYKKEDDRMIESYVREVEKNIRAEPAGWLWSHNRWKKRHLTRA